MGGGVQQHEHVPLGYYATVRANLGALICESVVTLYKDVLPPPLSVVNHSGSRTRPVTCPQSGGNQPKGLNPNNNNFHPDGQFRNCRKVFQSICRFLNTNSKTSGLQLLLLETLEDLPPLSHCIYSLRDWLTLLCVNALKPLTMPRGTPACSQHARVLHNNDIPPSPLARMGDTVVDIIVAKIYI